jgi:glycine dehydrogenase
MQAASPEDPKHRSCDLDRKFDAHRDVLAALMITHPSTHGVFENRSRKFALRFMRGEWFMDGANMNAQVVFAGGESADVCISICTRLLHSAWRGPGIGPICVAESLSAFLPGHSIIKIGGPQSVGEISEAPWKRSS